jgi:hypothetical protein
MRRRRTLPSRYRRLRAPLRSRHADLTRDLRSWSSSRRRQAPPVWSPAAVAGRPPQNPAHMPPGGCSRSTCRKTLDAAAPRDESDLR